MDRRHSVSDSIADSGVSVSSIDPPPSFNKMDRRHSVSDSIADSGVSDHSIDPPPSFNSGNLNLELQRSIEELKSEYDRNHQTLTGLIKRLNEVTDEVESVHKNSTMGSLVGSSIGAAGGIAALAGLALAPFTLGASLALTAAGVVAGVTGGVTGAASNITNAVKQKNLRETIEKIINDFQNTVQPMETHLSKIYDITENIELKKQTLNVHEIQRAARGAADVIKIGKIASVADIGQTCAEAAKDIRAYVKAVEAARGSAGAARAARATAEAAKDIRVAAAFTGGLSALFLALDVYCIVQDSTELSEMNQPADKRKPEEIKSETLKFILLLRETAAEFKKIVDKIEDTLDTYSTRCSSSSKSGILIGEKMSIKITLLLVVVVFFYWLLVR